jgi:hypothetical protein
MELVKFAHPTLTIILKKHVPPKRCYRPTSPHGVTAKKTNIVHVYFPVTRNSVTRNGLIPVEVESELQVRNRLSPLLRCHSSRIYVIAGATNWFLCFKQHFVLCQLKRLNDVWNFGLTFCYSFIVKLLQSLLANTYGLMFDEDKFPLTNKLLRNSEKYESRLTCWRSQIAKWF